MMYNSIFDVESLDYLGRSRLEHELMITGVNVEVV